MIVIYGTHVEQDNLSRNFFHFFKILIFQVVKGVKWQKVAQSDKNSVHLTSYLRNCTSYDCDFWYTCVK